MKVAVLFARADSIYKTMPDCDVYDIERNAMTYQGGMPIVAHPPCRAWGRLAHMAKPRDGEKALALWVVDRIRENGGVLEHPSASRLWHEKPLPVVGKRDSWGGFTMPISQCNFGHRAEKRTLLYICGCDPQALPDYPMVLGEAPCIIGTQGRRRNGERLKPGDHGWRPETSKREREATPEALAKWLVEVALLCGKK